MNPSIFYHSGFFTFEKAIEWAKAEVASGKSKNPRIMKNLTGPLAGRFTAMVDDINGHSLCTGWIDHSNGPNIKGDEAAFTLKRKVQ